MPLFAIICTDRPGQLDLRISQRPAHLAFLRASDCVRMAGPMIRDGGMIGSLLVVEAEDRAAAESWAAEDPFAKAGLFGQVRIEEWMKVIG